MKRAFTLIELLVVIAIIAILAAILFPVFAQAKTAAKKTQGLSNQKQLALGITMYVGDTDDTMPIAQTQNYGQAFPNDQTTWANDVQPYVKNWPLFLDPNEGKKYGWDGAANTRFFYNWMRWPQYGYNWGYMNLDPTCGNFGRNAATGKGYQNGPPISATTPASPAQTVVITDAKIAGDAAGYYTSFKVTSPAAYNAAGMCDFSNSGWGTGSAGEEPGLYPGNPTYTGNVAPRQSGGMNVGFMDGHAKYHTPGNLAAGTNWRKGFDRNVVQITDKEKYLWDLE